MGEPKDEHLGFHYIYVEQIVTEEPVKAERYVLSLKPIKDQFAMLRHDSPGKSFSFINTANAFILPPSLRPAVNAVMVLAVVLMWCYFARKTPKFEDVFFVRDEIFGVFWMAMAGLAVFVIYWVLHTLGDIPEYPLFVGANVVMSLFLWAGLMVSATHFLHYRDTSTAVTVWLWRHKMSDPSSLLSHLTDNDSLGDS